MACYNYRWYFVRSLGGQRRISLRAEECPTNVTSLSEEPSASLQQLAVARRRSYDPSWPRSLSY